MRLAVALRPHRSSTRGIRVRSASLGSTVHTPPDETLSLGIELFVPSGFVIVSPAGAAIRGILCTSNATWVSVCVRGPLRCTLRLSAHPVSQESSASEAASSSGAPAVGSLAGRCCCFYFGRSRARPGAIAYRESGTERTERRETLALHGRSTRCDIGRGASFAPPYRPRTRA